MRDPYVHQSRGRWQGGWGVIYHDVRASNTRIYHARSCGLHGRLHVLVMSRGQISVANCCSVMSTGSAMTVVLQVVR